MSFWIAAGLMTVAAVAVIAWPLLRGRSSPRDRHAENVGIYRQRLAELESEVEEGILLPEEIEATRAEIEKRLLEDVEENDSRDPETGVERNTTRRLVNAIVLWSILLAVPLSAIGLYGLLGAGPQAPQVAGERGGDTAANADMPELVANLAQRLRENPDNGEGWALLGRSYLFLERPDEAAQAFAKAHALLGDEPDFLIDYANALAMQSGGDLRGPAARLLQRALDQSPDNPRALWLGGLAATQRGDNERAGAYWRKLLQQLDPESEDAAGVRARLAELGGETMTAPAEQDAPVSSGGITVTVSLAPDIASRVGPQEPVFIFARAASGPPAPLAAVRRQVADLPLTIRLDDDDAMMAGRSLSGADRIIVGARISRSGGPIPQSGDIQGMSDILKLGEVGEVKIVIDSILP